MSANPVRFAPSKNHACVSEQTPTSVFLERLLDSIRVNDAEFEESDDEDDVQRQRTGAASQKRVRVEAEETAPKPAEMSADKAATLPTAPTATASPKVRAVEEPREPAPTPAMPTPGSIEPANEK